MNTGECSVCSYRYSLMFFSYPTCTSPTKKPASGDIIPPSQSLHLFPLLHTHFSLCLVYQVAIFHYFKHNIRYIQSKTLVQFTSVICTPSPSCLENTGFSGIHICVMRHFSSSPRKPSKKRVPPLRKLPPHKLYPQQNHRHATACLLAPILFSALIS